MHVGQLPVVIAPGHPHPDEQLLARRTQRYPPPVSVHSNSQIPEQPPPAVVVELVVLDVDELVEDVLVDVELVEVDVEDVLVEVDDVDVLVDDVLVDVELVDVDVEDVLVDVELVDVEVDDVLVDVVVETHSDSTQDP